VTVFDLTQSSRRSISHEGWNISGLDISPDGRWLALDCWGLGLRVWDLAGNRPLSPQPAWSAEIGITVAAFSPDGRWLAASRQNDCRIWRVGNWVLQNSLFAPSSTTTETSCYRKVATESALPP